MDNKDLFYRHGNHMVFPFKTRTKTLSSSAFHGGLRTDLRYALNINCQGAGYESDMVEDTYEKELMRQIRECEISPEEATALSTAAWTELSACSSFCFQDLTVQAVVSGSIDHNAVAPGDPTQYYEKDGEYHSVTPGTVNIFLFINQNLTDGAMVRAMMVCTEAKAAAVQELLLGSNYSGDFATGSGTDGCIIAANMEGEYTLTDASGHSKLGELIGKAVKTAVKGALMNQSGANGARQFQLLQRVKRFGISTGTLYDRYVKYKEKYKNLGITFENVSSFEALLLSYNQNSNLVLTTSLFVHLMDQSRWGLIMPGEVLREGKHLLMTNLYAESHQFLKDVYPENFFQVENFSESREERENPVILLEHFLILFLGCRT